MLTVIVSYLYNKSTSFLKHKFRVLGMRQKFEIYATDLGFFMLVKKGIVITQNVVLKWLEAWFRLTFKTWTICVLILYPIQIRCMFLIHNSFHETFNTFSIFKVLEKFKRNTRIIIINVLENRTYTFILSLRNLLKTFIC